VCVLCFHVGLDNDYVIAVCGYNDLLHHSSVIFTARVSVFLNTV